MNFLKTMERVLSAMKIIWDKISALFSCLKVIIEIITKLVNN